MGNSSGCCANSSEALIKKGDQDLNSLNQINNKNNENTKLINEIESKSNTNEVTNNNNIHNKNNPNNVPSAQKHSDFIKDLNKNNLNDDKENSESDSYNDKQNDNSSQDKEKISKGLVKMELPEGDQYEGETKDGKPYGRGHYISASGEEREGLFIEGLLNG